MSKKPTVYDFQWDENGDLGVCHKDPASNDLVLIEAQLMEKHQDPFDEEPPHWLTIGDYMNAGDIQLVPGDGVWLPDSESPVFGFAAISALRRLQRIEKEGQWVPVNEEQRSLANR